MSLQLHFDNSWTRLPSHFYSRVAITPLKNPVLVSSNSRLGIELGLSPEQLNAPGLLACLNGEQLMPGMEPMAWVYAGHQFGVFVPQLGDGRAILLGELINDRGRRYDLQVKGSGPTPYSRGFDGRAVLRSCIREYLAGEALWALGIPTTRALCLFTSDTQVQRERIEQGTALVRVARAHQRFGSFEFHHYRGDHDSVRLLADYVIELHFPQLLNTTATLRYRELLLEVVRRTARLMAHWQAVGFTHGVMNTDNMSVLGDTIDYGPYGFMEYYQPDYCPNHSDHEGRYAFQEQVEVGRWNCLALAEALSSLLPGGDNTMAVMSLYRDSFRQHYLQLMRDKLGLSTSHDGDGELVVSLLAVLTASGADYSRFFRTLSRFRRNGDNRDLPDLWPGHAGLAAWLDSYRQRLHLEDGDDARRSDAMNRVNPNYVLRNYLVQRAIELAERGDYREVDRLLMLVQDPFADHPGLTDYTRPVDPELPQVAISCSS